MLAVDVKMSQRGLAVAVCLLASFDAAAAPAASSNAGTASIADACCVVSSCATISHLILSQAAGVAVVAPVGVLPAETNTQHHQSTGD
jgi:hypothetical protein